MTQIVMNNLTLEATHRKAVALIDRGVVDSRVGVVEVPSPSDSRGVLRRRPEVQGVGAIVVVTTSITVAGND